MQGYWNDDEATAASFHDGWFHSGDIGFVDADGFLHVVDRMKDVVIRGGENVYCTEVEAVLHEHPAVAEVAIVGLDEPVMGERVCAVVVLRPGARWTSPIFGPSRRHGWPDSSVPKRSTSPTSCRRPRRARWRRPPSAAR